MVDFDWGKMRQELKEAKETAEEPIPDKLTGHITDIRQVTAGEVYGDTAKDPNRPVINITIQVTETGDTFKTAFTLPAGRASWRNPDFKLKQFADRYGDLPAVGMCIDVTADAQGYYHITL